MSTLITHSQHQGEQQMPVSECGNCQSAGSRLGQSLIALDGKIRYHREVDRRSDHQHRQWSSGWNTQRDQILHKLRVIDEHLESLAQEPPLPRLTLFDASPTRQTAGCAEVF